MLKEQIIDSGHRIRHWSDAGMMIRQIETGIDYEDAVDNIPCLYTYEETDKPILSDDEEAASEDYQEALEAGV